MACENCHKAKRKCVPEIGSNSCKHCVAKNRECVDHLSRQGERTDLASLSCSSLSDGVARSDLISLAPAFTVAQGNCNDGGGKSTSIELYDSESSSSIDTDVGSGSDYNKDDSTCSSSSGSSHGNHPGVCVNTSTEVATFLGTYATGSRALFTVTGPGRFGYLCVNHRFKINYTGPFTLITNTSMACMNDCGNGRYAMIRPRNSNGENWKFVFVASMHYLDSSNCNGTAHLFEWIGPMSPEGHPAFMDASNWNDASKNFRYVKHFSKDVLLLFVNVVRATTLFAGTSINPRTRNGTDGGIQCSPDGPDKCPFQVPFEGGRPNLTHLFEKHKPNNIVHTSLY